VGERGPDEVLRLDAERPPDAVRDVAELPARVDREDDVGRVRDEEPEPRLALAQLPLEALPLAHVAHRAVRTGEPALGVERAVRAELGQDGAAGAMVSVD